MLGFLITNNISYIITSRTVHKEPNGKNASWSVDGAQINIARHNDALSLERTLIVADYNLAEEGGRETGLLAFGVQFVVALQGVLLVRWLSCWGVCASRMEAII